MVESKQHLTPSEKRQGIVETTNGLFEDHLRLNSPYSRLFLDFWPWWESFFYCFEKFEISLGKNLTINEKYAVNWAIQSASVRV